MPNWCMNKLTIEHKDRSKVIEFVIAYKEGRVCEHYLPTPKNDEGELSEDWHQWRLDNWGTKWDIGSNNGEAYGLNPTVVDNEASMTFDSAWSPPEGLYKRLIELGFSVDASYFEPGMGFCGRITNEGDEYYGGSIADFPDDLIEIYHMNEFYTEEEV